MRPLKVIITGSTGMVGEGVLLACLQNKWVSEILLVNRKHYDFSHPKVKELLVPDFMQLHQYQTALHGYDACFFCAGISSVGMNETDYTQITYTTTLHFANTLVAINPQLIFTYVSGKSTDSSEQGKIMWARVKGKTENDLMKLPFAGVYNFRPGFMDPFKEQKNVKGIFKFFALFVPTLFPKSSITLLELGNAMVQVAQQKIDKQILEIPDIKTQALLGKQ